MRWVAASFLLASLSVSACSRPSTPIGNAPEDNVQWSTLPMFAHYAGTLTGATTVGDLMTKDITFSSRPDPTNMLRAMQAANPAATSNAVPVRVLTYNVGLLDVQLYGLVQYAQTPDLEARAAIMPETIFAQNYDIVGVQELWRPRDVQHFRTAAQAAGYWVVTSSRSGYTDGLAIAVKSSFAPPSTDISAEQYNDISPNEFFPANGYSRGFLALRIMHPTLGSIVIYDTHTAAFPSAYQLRMKHARELGLHARKFARANELLFVMGDMNASPYYKSDTWALPGGGSEPSWFANTLSYSMMMYYSDTVDLSVRGRTAATADLDVTEGNLVPNNPATALTTPFGDASYCARMSNVVFSGTDCNSMYFQQYAGTEFPARLDYILARDTTNRIHVDAAPLAFVTPVTYGGKTGPLSDHYGQSVDLRIAPTP